MELIGEDEGSQLSQNVGQLKMLSSDNKEYLTDVLTVEDVLRLIQSIMDYKTKTLNLLQWLFEHGQGGGNWRRLIIQLRAEVDKWDQPCCGHHCCCNKLSGDRKG